MNDHRRLNADLSPKKRPKIIKWLSIGTVVLLAGGLLSLYLWPQDRLQIPYDIQEAVAFKIVLPSGMPRDLNVITQPRYNSEKKLLVTTFGNDRFKITVSQQDKPAATDLKQLDSAATYLVGIGNVYTLKGEQNMLQSIVETSDSWVFVNADVDIGAEQYREFIQSLAPYPG